MSEPYIGQIILTGFGFAPQGYAFCNGAILSIAQNDALFNLIGTTFGGDGQTTFALPDLRGRIPIGIGNGGVIGEAGGVETQTLTVNQLPSHMHTIDLTGLTFTVKCRKGAGTETSPVNAVPADSPYVPYTDDPIVPGVTVIKAFHLTQIRSRIDTTRAANAMPAFVYTQPVAAAGGLVLPAQILDLRTALLEIYDHFMLQHPVFDPGVGSGQTVKAVHVQELRDALTALPPGASAPYSNVPPTASMAAGAIALSGGATAANTGGSQPHDNHQPFLAMDFCIALYGIFPSQS